MESFVALFKTLRPKQWTKNVFIFAALVFDKKLFDGHYLGQTVIGFVLFCLISGVVYTINDLVDLEKDRRHPKKRERPLAAGQIRPRTALVAVIILGLGTIWGAFWLDAVFGIILLGYLALQLAYSFKLKNIVLLDVLAIAAGFVLRVGAGVPLVRAERFSPWLYICMTLGALFLGLSKRRGELVLLEENAGNHREVLREYTLPLLDQLISAITASIILAYTLYTFLATNLPDNHLMMLTVPFVIYELFRYLYLIHVKGSTLPPDEVLLTDRPFFIGLLLWGVTVLGIFYWG